MTININIVSGFLGTGKTTFLHKLIPSIQGDIALIENEFGEIDIDGQMLKDNFPIKEICSGCICCSVVADFKEAIQSLVSDYSLNHIFIEPSGVASLSDIIRICNKTSIGLEEKLSLNLAITIIDLKEFNDCIDNFGSFYLDQIKNANLILFSNFSGVTKAEIEEIVSKVRIYNKFAFIFPEDWYELSSDSLAMIIDMLDVKEALVSEENESKLPAHNLFNSHSILNPSSFSEKEVDEIGKKLKDKNLGNIFRAKGILRLDNDKVVNFNFTPQKWSWNYIEKSEKEKVVVIGNELNKNELSRLFKSAI